MREKILEFVTRQGPVLSTDVAKEFRIDSMFAGAYLSELVKDKKIHISNTKVGSSPVYFIKSQEEKLQDYTKYLDQKEQRAFEMLKAKRVLWDKELDPVMQVAMRHIKDFAIPLRVNKTEIFWRFYLYEQEEAINAIKQILMKIEKQKEMTEELQKPVQKMPQKISQTKQAVKQEPQKISRKEKEVRQEIRPELKKEEVRKTSEINLDDQKRLMREILREELEIEKKKLEKEFKEKLEFEKRALLAQHSKQEKLDIREVQDLFFLGIKKRLIEMKINIVSFDILKAEKEAELIVEVPSAIGHITYFCQAKNRKRCTEKDLEEISSKSREKGFPALLICGGLTKSAEENAGKNFKNVQIVKV